MDVFEEESSYSLSAEELSQLRLNARKIERNYETVGGDEIVRQFQPMARGLARRYQSNLKRVYISEADLAQEGLLQLLRVWDQYDPSKGAITTWAHRVMANRIYQAFKLATFARTRALEIDDEEGKRWAKQVHSLEAAEGWEEKEGWDEEIPLGELALLPADERFVILALDAGHPWVQIADWLKLPRKASSIEALLQSASQRLGYEGPVRTLLKTQADLNEEEVEELVRRYGEGESAASIARDLNCSSQVALAVLEKLGLKRS